VSAHNFARLRHRVTIEVATHTADGSGGFVETWTPLAEAWAEIVPGSGSERLDADRFAGRVTHQIVMRHRSDLSAGCRLRRGERLFHVHAVIDVGERRRWSLCLAEERGL
jgi:SPP1 family predicted phage head-tail adaptor